MLRQTWVIFLLGSSSFYVSLLTKKSRSDCLSPQENIRFTHIKDLPGFRQIQWWKSDRLSSLKVTKIHIPAQNGVLLPWRDLTCTFPIVGKKKSVQQQEKEDKVFYCSPFRHKSLEDVTSPCLWLSSNDAFGIWLQILPHFQCGWKKTDIKNGEPQFWGPNVASTWPSGLFQALLPSPVTSSISPGHSFTSYSHWVFCFVLFFAQLECVSELWGCHLLVEMEDREVCARLCVETSPLCKGKACICASAWGP